jgi:hypothetical protein
MLSSDEMVQGAFEANDEQPKKVSEFISILNRVDLSKSSRKLIWDLIIQNQLPYDQFIKQFDYSGDEHYLLQYGMIVNSKELVIETSKKSIQLFELSFEWLQQNAELEIYSFGYSNSILSFKECGKIVISYVDNFSRKLNGEEDIKILLAPLTKRLSDQISLILAILEDPAENGLTEDDFLQLSGGLDLFGQLHINEREIFPSFCQLKDQIDLPQVKAKLNLNSLGIISSLLKKCILI